MIFYCKFRSIASEEELNALKQSIEEVKKKLKTPKQVQSYI